ncbi:MAG TPA: serine/threonine-protein kinase [Solirubrobacterales bacterium]|nr:serine/threonine-protein kinase [Solirubrobacterales bacterium]
MAEEPRIPENALRAAVDDLDAIEFIASGGQGDAWRVRRKGGEDEVLKVVVNADPARVKREIGAMQAVDNPYVMGFTEAGTLDHNGSSYPFLIGEYVPGKSVAQRVEDGDWPDEKEALALAVGALRGLSAIHEVETVHRDIKPGNLALRDDDWSRPVILDLGLVRDLVGDSITAYPDLLGTIPFMSPEQLRREKAVKRSDVFGVGVTLFLLLTKGRHPFIAQGENIALEVLEERMRDGDWPKWEDVNGIDSDVIEVLSLILRPDAFRRPRAGAAADALEALQGDN